MKRRRRINFREYFTSNYPAEWKYSNEGDSSAKAKIPPSFLIEIYRNADHLYNSPSLLLHASY